MDCEGYFSNILFFVWEVVKYNVIILFWFWNLMQDNFMNVQMNWNWEILEVLECEFNLDFWIEEKVVLGSGVKIVLNVYFNQDYEFQWLSLDVLEDDGKGFCYVLCSQVVVFVDGMVVLCCFDGEGVINFGNVYEKFFLEIVEGEWVNNLVYGFFKWEVVEELCWKCGYCQWFGVQLNRNVFKVYYLNVYFGWCVFLFFLQNCLENKIEINLDL